jgi:prevent-host-death family protein
LTKYFSNVKTVLISEFKAKCIQMLKEVQKNGKPLTVTLRGEPIARVEPVAKGSTKKRRLGALRGRMIIKGDIMKSDFEKDWAAR